MFQQVSVSKFSSFAKVSLRESGNFPNFFDLDCSPYGTLLDGRHGNETSYRFGYQGSEKDDELKGSGNSYTTHFRLLDPRIGRWFSTDPVFQPWQSPYTSMDNNPVLLNDPLGNVAKGGGKDGPKKLNDPIVIETDPEKDGMHSQIVFNWPGGNHQSANPVWNVYVPSGSTLFSVAVEIPESVLSPQHMEFALGAFETPEGDLFTWNNDAEWYVNENGVEYDDTWTNDMYNAGMSVVAPFIDLTMGDGFSKMVSEAEKSGMSLGDYMFVSMIEGAGKFMADMWYGGHRRSNAILSLWFTASPINSSVLLKGFKKGLVKNAIKSADDITEDAIKKVLENSPLVSRQGAVSLPMVKRYFKMLQDGSAAPAIKVTTEGVIVEGNHRYIAGVLFGEIPEVVPGVESMSTKSLPVVKWSDFKIDPVDWDPPK